VLTWSGFYVGAGIGAGAVVHDIDVDIDGFELVRFDGIGGEGIFGTVIVGWDWQIGSNTVFGVFADYDFSDISTDFSAFNGFIDASIDHDNSWAIGARLGWLSNPGTLWYLTGGYTQANFDASASVGGVSVFSRDRTFDGFFVGAGIDTRLAASNWFLRLEYRFSQFDSETVFREDDLSIDVEPSMHTARLTLTYKFGGGYGWNWGQ
jgi:outer membrane immunogenic protein